MQNLLIAIVAGLVGAVATVGTVAIGLIDVSGPERAPIARVEGPQATQEFPAADTSALEDEIRTLNQRLQNLELDLSQAQASGDVPDPSGVASLRARVEALEKGGSRAVATAGNGGSDVVDGEFSTVVERQARAVYEQMRMAEQQEQRVARLEQRKQMVENTMPRWIERSAQRLNVPEALIPDVSEALVAHAKRRLEIQSEQEDQRIRGQTVDEGAMERQLEQLDYNTGNILKGMIASDAADSLLTTANNMTRGGGMGFAAGTGGGRMGGGAQRRTARGE
jgi:hypothetical protein